MTWSIPIRVDPGDTQSKIKGVEDSVAGAERKVDNLSKTFERLGETMQRRARQAEQHAQQNNHLANTFAKLGEVMERRARMEENHARINNTLANSFASLAQAVQRDQQMLESIHGPMVRYEQDVQTLERLHARGAITANQYAQALAKSRSTAGVRSPLDAVSLPGPAKPVGRVGASETGLVGTVATAAIGTYGISTLTGLSDSYDGLRNRLRQVSGAQGDLNGLMGKVSQVARDTRSDLGTTGEAFVRLTQATKNMGVSQADALKITATLNMALQSSGASASEASSGTLQLMQAMAAGALQGDEFRSLAENMPQLLEVFANQLGVTRGELKKMGSEGKITTDIMVKGLLAYGPQAKKTFEDADVTFSQFATNAKNAATEFVGSRSLMIDTIKKTSEASQLLRIQGLEEAASTKGLAAEYNNLANELRGLTAEQAKGVLKAIEVTETGLKVSLMVKEQIELMENLRKKVSALADPWTSYATQADKSFGQIRDQLIGSAAMFIKYRQEGTEAMKAFRSPMEKHADEIKAAKDLWTQGKITAEEYGKAVRFINAENARGDGLKTFAAESPGFSSSQALENQWRPQTNFAAMDTGWTEGITAANIELVTMQRYLDHVSLQAKKYELDMASANDGVARGFNKVGATIMDTASLTENLITSAAQNMEDAFVNAALTGELSFSKMVDQLMADLARLAIRQLAAAALTAAIGGGGGGDGSKGIAMVADAFGFGSAGLDMQVPHFAAGGAMRVPGSGGTDTTFVPLMATPGERIIVQTPGQQAAAREAADSPARQPQQPMTVVLDQRAIVQAQKSPMGVRAMDDMLRKNPSLLRRR